MFHSTGARKKKCLTDPVSIIPYPDQNLRDKAQKATVKPVIKGQAVNTPKAIVAEAVIIPQEKKEAPLVKEAPREVKTPLGNLKTSNLSINKMMNKKEDVGKKQALNRDTMPKNPYTMDDFKMLWRQYAFEMKEKGRETFYNALIKREPTAQGDDNFLLEVDNQVQIDLLRPLLMDLHDFIRLKLNNYQIDIVIQLTDNPEEELKFQTGKDKFAALARKNPNLHTLKNTFNLDIEY